MRRDRWGSEAARWGYKEYQHGLVHEAGMHDLTWVLSHMHQSSAQARDVLRQVAQCLAHMHEDGRIVGDLNPSHIVQVGCSKCLGILGNVGFWSFKLGGAKCAAPLLAATSLD